MFIKNTFKCFPNKIAKMWYKVFCLLLSNSTVVDVCMQEFLFQKCKPLLFFKLFKIIMHLHVSLHVVQLTNLNTSVTYMYVLATKANKSVQ